MGKGQRRKKPNRFIHSDADESEEMNDDGKSMSIRKNKLKVCGRKTVNVSINKDQSDDNFTENEQNMNKALPVWPTEIQSPKNNENIVSSITNTNDLDYGEFLFVLLVLF